MRGRFLEECGVGSDVMQDLLKTLSESFDERCRISRSLNRQGAHAQSLLEWGRTYLEDYFIKLPSSMHRWLASELDECDSRRGAKINLVGPRGGAKIDNWYSRLCITLRRARHRTLHLGCLGYAATGARAPEKHSG